MHVIIIVCGVVLAVFYLDMMRFTELFNSTSLLYEYFSCHYVMIIDNKYFELKTSGTAVMMIDQRFIDIDVDEMSKLCTKYISNV